MYISFRKEIRKDVNLCTEDPQTYFSNVLRL